MDLEYGMSRIRVDTLYEKPYEISDNWEEQDLLNPHPKDVKQSTFSHGTILTFGVNLFSKRKRKKSLA